MAIIFESHKETKKNFILKLAFFIALFVIFILSVFFFMVFISSYSGFLPDDEDMPSAMINFVVLDSQEVRGLDYFEPVKMIFIYTGLNQEGVLVSGEILSDSRNEARRSLEQMGFTDLNLEESPIGRDNPFEVYYSISR